MNPAKKLIGSLYLEYRVYLNYLKKREIYGEKKKFVIYGQGRSGSTLLVTLLNSHSSIRCHDELLYDRRLLPHTYVKSFVCNIEKPLFGFHVKCYQILHDQKFMDPLKYLQKLERENWKIIYLYRKNIFKQAVSPLIASERKVWHVTNQNAEGSLPSVKLDKEHVLKCIIGRENYLQTDNQIIENFDHIKVQYERDLMDGESRQRTTGKLCQFLDVPVEDLSSPLKKTTGSNLADAISNYDEVIEHIENNGYGWVLQLENDTREKQGS